MLDVLAAQEAQVHLMLDDPCLPKGLILPDARHTGVTLHGTGDFVQCLRRQAPLLTCFSNAT
jgi:hypothetical protein